MNDPFVSIICPIYNEEKYISKCVESVLSQDYPKDKMEVLFVDGRSADKTRALLQPYIEQYAFIKLLDNPQRTVPYAMNKGILNASGSVIVRLDAHAIYPENYISVLIAQLNVLNADNVGAVCRTLPVNDSPKCRAIAAALSGSFGMGNSYFRVGVKEIMQVDTVPFGCYRKEVFDKIGLYDVDLTRNQDDELNARLIKNGGKIYLLPFLQVNYFTRDTIGKTGKMFYQYGLYKPLVNKKLGSPATIRQFFPVLFVLGLILGFFASLLSVYLWMIYGIVLVCYGLLAFISSVKAARSMKQIGYQMIAYFVIHFNYGWGYLVGLYKVVTHQSFEVKINR